MPEGLISGMLNKGIEMRGFWSGFNINKLSNARKLDDSESLNKEFLPREWSIDH